MAAEFDSCFFVDKPAYSSFSLALQSLDPKIYYSIQTWNEISQTNKQGALNLIQKSFFMAITKPTFIQKTGECLSLKLDELCTGGFETGASFYLTLDREISRKWLSNPTLKLVSPKENFLIVFQGIPLKVRACGKTINIGAPPETVCAKIILKHYFNVVPSMPNTQIFTMSEAINHSQSSFDVFAVVHYVVKKPELTNEGKAHGIFTIIERSSSERNPSEYDVHVVLSSLNVFPEIQAGDVLKFKGISTQKLQSNKNEVYIAMEDHQLIVYPKGDTSKPPNWETPKSATDYFKVTQSDYDYVTDLKKKKGRDLMGLLPSTPEPAQEPSNPEQVETARQNGRPRNTSSHEDYLVEENEQFPNLKSPELTDQSTQSQNDEQGQSSGVREAFKQLHIKLKKIFLSSTFNEQDQLNHKIALLCETFNRRERCER